MPRVIAAISLFLSAVLVQAQETPEGTVVGVDDVAARLVVAESEESVREILESASEAGFSDVQLATAFGLAIETLLEQGPRERLPVVMSTFESFVSASAEPPEVISAALESGQDLARSRAEAGEPMIASGDGGPGEMRSPRSSLRPSPVGGGSSARDATGGGGGGVVAGGASPS